jgi:hypothetical protein
MNIIDRISYDKLSIISIKINVRYFNAFNKKTSYKILRFTFETTINSSSALF